MKVIIIRDTFVRVKCNWRDEGLQKCLDFAIYSMQRYIGTLEPLIYIVKLEYSSEDVGNRDKAKIWAPTALHVGLDTWFELRVC